MFNVDVTGTHSECSEAVRLAIIAETAVDPDLIGIGRIQAKFFAQVISSYSSLGAITMHVVSSGTITIAGAVGLTLDITIL